MKPPPTKRCSHCKQEKDRSCYGKDPTRRDGLHCNCKACIAEYQRKRRARERPAGIRWCPSCSRWRPLAAFHDKAKRGRVCIDCKTLHTHEAKARFNAKRKAKRAAERGRDPKIDYRRGSKHHYAKLTEPKVAIIKGLLALGMSQSALARKHKVDLNAIHLIKLGRTWKHVKPADIRGKLRTKSTDQAAMRLSGPRLRDECEKQFGVVVTAAILAKQTKTALRKARRAQTKTPE
jgi:hypothetical protein